MAYCVLNDVRALIPRFTLSATTSPSEIQATTFLDDIASEIDIALARSGIATPVTTPATFTTWLKKVNAEGVAATILKAMFPDSNGPAETPAYAFFETRYKAALKLLQDGDLVSTLTGSAGDAMEPSTYFTRNPDTEEDLGTIGEPLFKISKTF